MMTLYWSVLIVVILFLLPKVYPLVKTTDQYKVYTDAMVFVLILTVVKYFFGFVIYNIGYSPYSFKPNGILLNMINILLPLLARELVRGYILNTYGPGKYNQIFILITIVFVLGNLNLNAISGITNAESATVYIIKNIVISLCEGILLSYLALYGGAISSVIYVCFAYTFQYLIPYLPNLNWFVEGIIGIIIPLYAATYLVNKYKKVDKRLDNKKGSLKELISTSFTLGLSVLIIWFVVGVFPIVPSVIATGSMEPLIKPGDVILIEKIQSEDEVYNLKKGDIIQFQRGNIVITHRIYKLDKDNKGKLCFITKGDNNSTYDSQKVKPKDIKGSLISIVPKIGYPTLIFKQDKGVERNQVEF
jgi:signal peptidase I, archaeal type